MAENELTPEVLAARPNPAGIGAVFLNRWSPRSLRAEEPVAEADLRAVLEAARWAPSCFNGQPWRFLVARDPAGLDKMRSCLTQSNRVWADRAPALVTVLSRPTFELDGRPNRWHAFDAGAAWGYLALEASRRGLVAHAMGGFSEKKLRELYGVPAEWGVHAVVALGRRAPKEQLPPELQEREAPTTRKPLEELWSEGEFRFK